VTGEVHPDRIVRNSTAKPGDILLLTKPIGTGILATALKRGLLDDAIRSVLTRTMATLNKDAAEAMLHYPVSACTDITGFGLLGHLLEITSSSGMDAELFSTKVILLPGVEELAAAGVVPGGSRANLEHVSGMVEWQESVPDLRRIILCDAQTSGGLLIAIPERFAKELAEKTGAVAIGRVTGSGQGRVSVV
jgi:selenide,water dikinase